MELFVTLLLTGYLGCFGGRGPGGGVAGKGGWVGSVDTLGLGHLCVVIGQGCTSPSISGPITITSHHTNDRHIHYK